MFNFSSWKNSPQGKAIEDFFWFTLYAGVTSAVAAAGTYATGHQADLTSLFGAAGFTLIVAGIKAVSLFIDRYRNRA